MMDEKHGGQSKYKAKGAYQSSVGQSPDRATHTECCRSQHSEQVQQTSV